jgi:hypothetical protein
MSDKDYSRTPLNDIPVTNNDRRQYVANGVDRGYGNKSQIHMNIECSGGWKEVDKEIQYDKQRGKW